MKTFFVAALVAAEASDESHRVNPIRKVVTLLQNMEKKVSGEGEKEKKIFEKFMCYCKNGADALAKSIADAGNKMPQLEAGITEGEAHLVQLKAEVKAHQTERAEAKTAIASATAVREKENAEFKAATTDLKTNVAAMAKAVKALSAGMEGSFLQTADAQILKKLILAKQDMNDGDRQEVVSFLSDREEYAPASGEIVGILKTMGDEMAKDLASKVEAEQAAVTSFDGLIKAKTKEIEAATKMIETKLTRIGDVGVEIQEMRNDLGDTGEALLEDKKFIADLEKNCETKQKLFAENVKMRGQELLALQDTIKLLNDDDALELFKKTLPGASSSFLQVRESSSEMRSRALDIVRKASQLRRNPHFDFLSLALNGKKIGFGKIIKMIDDLTVELKKEAQDDLDKKEYCEKEFDIADDKKKSQIRDIAALETSIQDAKETISTLVGEIDALGDGIKALDKQVTEATEQRKEEASDYTTNLANNAAAVELLGFAKNRLNKFYNPKLYKEPPAEFVQADPGPAPEAPKAYSKKSEESNGVIAMIDTLVRDVEKEMTEAEFTEKDAQGDYETFMSDSSAKRTEDSKSLTDKEATLAEVKTNLQDDTETKKTTSGELMATEQYISNLHADCDFLLKYFDVRAEARNGEIDAMSKCKAVLSGADYSLIQTHVKRSLRGL